MHGAGFAATDAVSANSARKTVAKRIVVWKLERVDGDVVLKVVVL